MQPRDPTAVRSKSDLIAAGGKLVGPPAPTLRSLAALGMGNAFELYDFLTFSTFAIQIGRSLFPRGATSTALLSSLALFGAGFFSRPLGALIIGRYADRSSRKGAMVFSFVLMGVATLSLAATPSYADVGLAAPLWALASRLLQGFALGAEIGPSTAYLLEAAPLHRRGLFVAVQSATQGLAMLAAALLGFELSRHMSEAVLDAWGWRASLLVGVLVTPLGIYLRRALPEGACEAAPTLHSKPTTTRLPMHLLALGLPLLAAMTIATYVRSYMTTYVQDTLHLSPTIAFGAGMLAGGCALIACPLAGAISDRAGRKRIMLAALMLSAALSVPGFLWIHRVPTTLVICTVTTVLSFIGWTGNVVGLIALCEAFPHSHRSAALGTVYAAAIALAGGSTQFVVQWLIHVTGNPLAPAWYSMAALLVGTVAAIGLPETAPKACEVNQGPVRGAMNALSR